jgi:very-short-patch-repair endonuclease
MPRKSRFINLQDDRPDLYLDWHTIKNPNLNPLNLHINTKRKAWWLCVNGHEWETRIDHRMNGSGCPFCKGKKASKSNNLLFLNPKVAKEWHLTKNKGLSPENVVANSHKSAWWICENNHEWKAQIKSRNNGVGCPFCKNKRATISTCLKTINPDLAKEWHPTKNGLITPDIVLPFSNKKVWWLCENGHEWQAQITKRSNGNNCPFCSGRYASKYNSLQYKNPKLCQEWHPTRNGNLKPNDVTSKSRKKVWWICKNNHEWETAICEKKGCPYCDGRIVCEDNSLQVTNPELANEWDYKHNGNLKPAEVTSRYGKLLWWACERGHEYQTSINLRLHGLGCPYCSGHRVSKENCLKTVNPTLAKEWHPNRNKPLGPTDVTTNSSKKVWWLCKRNHEWQAVISSRNRGNGCPYCNSQSSQLELRVYTELNFIFEKVNARIKIGGKECDIFLKNFKIGIEVDGVYYHRVKFAKDLEKNLYFSKLGIIIIRIREKGLKKLSKNDLIYHNSEDHFSLIKKLLLKIIRIAKIDKKDQLNIKKYLLSGKLANDHEYINLLNTLPSPMPEFSLAECNKKLSLEWNHSKNGSLTPYDVKPNSNLKVWWICNSNHEWQATINNRNKGRNCPFCSSKKVFNGNCLETADLKLSTQWHPTKNIITPKDVTRFSSKRAWWLCENGHEWEAIINNRSSKGRGCPYCSGQKTCADKSLQKIDPDLAKEWHPTLNGNLTPRDVSPKSGKKIWWICKNGHEWQSDVYSRSRGSGCPYCSGHRVGKDNNLSVMNTNLAKEWHPTKNLLLQPTQVTCNSHRKVWWQCSYGHEWEAAISSRNGGSGCPSCYKNRRFKTNSI